MHWLHRHDLTSHGSFCADVPGAGGMSYPNLGPEAAQLLAGFADGVILYGSHQRAESRQPILHAPDFDPIWAGFAERRRAVAVHVAANGNYSATTPSFRIMAKIKLV